MNTKESADKIDSNLGKETQQKGEAIDLVSRIVCEVIKTPGSRKVILSVLSNILSAWSEKSLIKKKVSGNAIKMVSGVIDPKSEPKTKLSESVLFADVGKLITLLAINISDIHKENPTYYVDRLRKPINDIIENIDFGELKEMIEGSEDSVVAKTAVLNDVLWEYPAKVVCLLASIPPIINIAVKLLNELIKPVNNILSPDLFADIVLSLLRTIEANEIGLLVNSLGELIRRLHTGSVLQGKSGIPLFQVDLTNKLRDVISTIDPKLFYKAKVALAEDAESITNSITDAILDNPAPFMAITSAFSSINNPKIRRIRRMVGVFEDFPQEELTEATLKGLADLDTQEIGEIVNTLLRVINSIHENKPEIVSNLISSIVLAIDTDELKATADWIIRDAIDAIKPAAGVIVPSLLNGLCELIVSVPGEDSNDLDNALDSLKGILCKNGGKK